MPIDQTTELVDLADRQEQVVSREQLAALGIDRNRIRDQVQARRWRLVGRAVVLHRGPLPLRQRWWVAVIHAGPDAALASLSAAQSYGLAGWEPSQVHVVVRRGARVHTLPWMRVHQSRRYEPDDVHPTRIPAQCLPARAVVDAATWKPHPRLACAVLAAAVQQRLTTVPLLRQQIETSGSIRHRRLMLRALDDIEGGAHALSEIDLVRLCRKAGLPKPEQQVMRRDSSGSQRYLDARLRRPDGRVILIEVDGAFHLLVDRWWDDQNRSNDLVIEEDAIMLRFPSVVLRTDEKAVIAQFHRAYFGDLGVVRRAGRGSARSA